MNDRTPLPVLEAGFDDTAELQRALIRNGCDFPVVKEVTPGRTTLAEVQSWKADILKAVAGVERIPGLLDDARKTVPSPHSAKAIGIIRRLGTRYVAEATGLNWHTVRKAFSRYSMGDELASKIIALEDVPTPPERKKMLKKRWPSYAADPRINEVIALVKSEGAVELSNRVGVSPQALNRICRIGRVIGRTADRILGRKKS